MFRPLRHVLKHQTVILAFCLGILCQSLLIPGLQAQDQDWKLLISDVPPYAFRGPDGQPKGFCVDVVREIQRRLGNTTPILIYPWARAYDMGLHKKNVILICPKRTAERESKFKWVGPLLDTQLNLYTKTGSGIRINSINDAKAARGILVWYPAYAYEHLREQGFTNLDKTIASANLIKMLLGGRQPLMAVDQEEIPSMLANAHMDKDAIEIAYRLTDLHIYLAFSKDAPDVMQRNWQKGLDDMKKDGTFEKMKRRWLSADVGDLR